MGVVDGRQVAGEADGVASVLVGKTLRNEPVQQRGLVVRVQAQELLLGLGGVVLRREDVSAVA